MDNHAWTAQRYKRVGGSLHPEPLDRLAELRPGRVLEFGSGYSTLFLAKTYQCDYVAVEHDPTYVKKVKPHEADAGFSLVSPEIRGYSDEFIEQLHKSETPRMMYDREHGKEVPRGNWGMSGHRNTWYGPEVLDLLVARPDLVVHDGCNGSGRGIAFPLLRDAIKGPFFLFVDDLQAFDFDERMREHFKVDELWTFGKNPKCSLFLAEAK